MEKSFDYADADISKIMQIHVAVSSQCLVERGNDISHDLDAKTTIIVVFASKLVHARLNLCIFS